MSDVFTAVITNPGHFDDAGRLHIRRRVGPDHPHGCTVGCALNICKGVLQQGINREACFLGCQELESRLNAFLSVGRSGVDTVSVNTGAFRADYLYWGRDSMIFLYIYIMFVFLWVIVHRTHVIYHSSKAYVIFILHISLKNLERFLSINEVVKVDALKYIQSL